ncbi:MAG: hypothetical protein OXU19_16190, partial [bacterium]|nr:hypothetical protein [bacterium]
MGIRVAFRSDQGPDAVQEAHERALFCIFGWVAVAVAIAIAIAIAIAVAVAVAVEVAIDLDNSDDRGVGSGR